MSTCAALSTEERAVSESGLVESACSEVMKSLNTVSSVLSAPAGAARPPIDGACSQKAGKTSPPSEW